MDDMEITQAVLEMFERDYEFFNEARAEMADVTLNITGYGGFTGARLEEQILLGDFGKNSGYVIQAYKEELAEKCEWARKEVFHRLKEIRLQNYIDSYLD